jgi:hypothetical protein
VRGEYTVHHQRDHGDAKRSLLDERPRTSAVLLDESSIDQHRVFGQMLDENFPADRSVHRGHASLSGLAVGIRASDVT